MGRAALVVPLARLARLVERVVVPVAGEGVAVEGQEELLVRADKVDALVLAVDGIHSSVEHRGRKLKAILSDGSSSTLNQESFAGWDMVYSLSLISYSSCTISRHWPSGSLLSKAASRALYFFHFSRKYGQSVK